MVMAAKENIRVIDFEKVKTVDSGLIKGYQEFRGRYRKNARGISACFIIDVDAKPGSEDLAFGYDENGLTFVKRGKVLLSTDRVVAKATSFQMSKEM